MVGVEKVVAVYCPAPTDSPNPTPSFPAPALNSVILFNQSAVDCVDFLHVVSSV